MSANDSARFMQKMQEVMPHMADCFDDVVADDISLDDIEERAFSESEHLGGIASVIAALIKQEVVSG